MIYFEIKNADGDLLASNMNLCQHRDLFISEKQKVVNEKGLKLRSGYLKKNDLNIWMIAENETDLFKSNKRFKKVMGTYLDTVSVFHEYYLHKITAHSHTLRSIQGKMQQKIDGFARKSHFRGKNYSESIQNISTLVKESSEKTADLLCYLNKRVSEINTHILGFDLLFMGKEFPVSLKEHNIKKVIQNIIAPFLNELNKLDIQVNFLIKDSYAEQNKIQIDYRLMNLALVNFFENILKYAQSGSALHINFKKERNNFFLSFQMMSRRIEKEELEKIFHDGYCGANAKNDAGDGIGMYIVQKSLDKMHLNMSVSADYSISNTVSELQYIQNEFMITRK